MTNRKGEGMRQTWVMRLARLQPWYWLARYPNRLSRSVFVFCNGCVAVAIMAAAAIWTNQPLIFPSLGPTTFLLFAKPSAPTSAPCNVITGHCAGILVGWLCFTLIGHENAFAEVATVALSLGLISVLMIAGNIPHPPAASTTLIISLGLMTGWDELLALVAAVILLTVQAFCINRIFGISYPVWKAKPEHGGQELVVSALGLRSAPQSGDTYAELADRLAARDNLNVRRSR